MALEPPPFQFIQVGNDVKAKESLRKLEKETLADGHEFIQRSMSKERGERRGRDAITGRAQGRKGSSLEIPK